MHVCQTCNMLRDFLISPLASLIMLLNPSGVTLTLKREDEFYRHKSLHIAKMICKKSQSRYITKQT